MMGKRVENRLKFVTFFLVGTRLTRLPLKLMMHLR